MLKVFTSQIGYAGDLPALDITIRSGDKAFAPTWDMVMSFRRGQLSWEEYEERYYAMMRRSWVENNQRWQEVLAMDEVVLTCYCRGDAQCHRRLLKDMLVKCGAEDGGEIPPSEPSIKIAFTGHRDLWDRKTVETAKWWCGHIAQKHPDAIVRTGGAVGVDKIVATQALRFGLRSEIYLPFPFEVFTASWKKKTQKELAALLAQSDVTVVGEKFSYAGYLDRNAKMVADADVVVAFYDGRSGGGTYHCIIHALSIGKPVYNAFTRQEIPPVEKKELDARTYYRVIDRWVDENFIAVPTAMYTKLGVGKMTASPHRLENNETRFPKNYTTVDPDDASYISSKFILDNEAYGDPLDALVAKEQELGQANARWYLQSADFEVFNGQVFERHENTSWNDEYSVAARVFASTKCPKQEAFGIAQWLGVVDPDGNMEKYWASRLKQDYAEASSELFRLYLELSELLPNKEDALEQEWLQSYNDDPSEDTEEVVADASYGWHKVPDPDWEESKATNEEIVAKLRARNETLVSTAALGLLKRLRILKGNALRQFGARLYKMQKGIIKLSQPLTQSDWSVLWQEYHTMIPIGG